MSHRPENDLVYSSGQARALLPYWPKEAKWFVIGGPADGDEAQTLHREFPDLKCIGFEPNKELYDKQVSMDFPGELYNLALWSKSTYLDLTTPGGGGIGPRSSTVCRGFAEGQPIASSVSVKAVTLDQWCRDIRDVVLWLDVEGAELEVLKGATELLKRTLLISLESLNDSYMDTFTTYLSPMGFEKAGTWNEHALPGMCDVIYRRKA